MLGEEYRRALETMGESGIGWVDGVFQICVFILVDLAKFLGISYEEINVWIFCIIWPLLSLILFAEVIRLRIKNEQMIKNRS